jgi:hypothetical protein
MECFYSGGGRSNPGFQHQVRVRRCSGEAYQWCLDYDNEGKHFRRFYVEWGHDKVGYDLVQFEWEEVALLFALKFGHE